MQNRFRTTFIALSAVLIAAPTAAQTTAGGAVAAMRADYGISIAVGDDEVIVGEPNNRVRSGIAYVYRRSGGAWTEVAQLTAPDAQWSDGFATALALDGQRLLVSMVGDDEPGVVHVFEESAGEWRHVGQFTAGAGDDDFGASLALSGGMALVGAPAAGADAGAVYVFARGANGAWSQQARLTAAAGAAGDELGASVAFLGQRAVIGAPGAAAAAGRVYLFAAAGGMWSEGGAWAPNGLAPGTEFGASLATSGQRAFIGAPSYGVAPAQQGQGRGGRGGRGGGGGGASVGAVFAFEYDVDDDDFSEVGRYLPFAAGGGDDFGSSIAVNAGELWFGAPGDGAGSTFLYSVSADGPIGVQRFAPAVAAGGGRGGMEFGAAIAARGDIAAVGMPGADGSGKVQIFERRDGMWMAANELQGPPDALPAVAGDEVRCGETGKAVHFDCSSVDLVAYMPTLDVGGTRTSRINDVWGWTDEQTGNEYVIVGRSDGAGFVDISDPTNPRFLGNLPRTEGTQTSTWRDMKVYNDHVFIVADGAAGHGMQVFDLTRLRDVTAPVEFTEDAHYDGISSVHNIVLNEESGFAYAVGARQGGETCGGGLHMIDVRDPKNPTFAGCFSDPETGRSGTGYSHDAQCVTYHGPDQDYAGHEICIGANETAISVADVTDKANPVAVASASYPGVGYAHQGWFTEDHRYFYLDDELDEINADGEGTPLEGTRTMIWDLADLDDPRLAGMHYGATQASDHNLYIVGNTMYQSNYQAGLRVLDISDPENPVEFGFLDTVPYGTNTAGFGGSWSNYPFFESGVIAVTSGSEGLLLVRVRNPRVVSQ